MPNSDRTSRILKTFNAKDELQISHPEYQKFLSGFFDFFLPLDLGTGDTSQFPAESYKSPASAVINAKEDGIVAGTEELLWLCEKESIKCELHFSDGDSIKSSQCLAEFQAPVGRLLAVERTLLNFLQRMFGIATNTRHYADKLQNTNTYIIGTRKTQWGKVDKKAIIAGGGLTHRLNLADAAMLKENHLTTLRKDKKPDSIKNGITSIIQANPSLRFVEVEVTSEAEFWEIATILSDVETENSFVIMFDHFSPNQIASIIEEMKNRNIYDKILLEASGDMNLETIEKYIGCGVDVISSGALTHSVKGLDLTMLIQ